MDNNGASGSSGGGVVPPTSSRVSWVVDFQKEVDGINMESEKKTWTKHSIYMVPACIKQLNPPAYAPQVVSFGPYHHEDKALQPMEEHKRRALVHFLKRSSMRLESFVSELQLVEQQLMDAYDGLEEEYWRSRPGRFLQMMTLDGCFMLEVMRYTNELSAPAAATAAAESKYKDYNNTDPIFSWHGVLYAVPYIKRDMLMMENQLPLLVLSTLLAVEAGKPTHDDTTNRLVLKFLAPGQRHLVVPLGLHPLDVYRKSMLQGPRERHVLKKKHDEGGVEDIVRSAMELNEAGVRFKPSKTNSLVDIHFKHGVLSLPVVVVDDLTEYMFLNLMAFERLHVGAGNEVTSYVFFMDNLIDSAKDVSLLNSKGIIHNAVGSDKAVAKLFNTLSKDVAIDPDSPLEDVHRRVKHYCGKRWNMWRANLIHTYFRNPWAFLSVAAAIFLLVLTVAQTVFGVLQWRQGLSNETTPPPPPFLAPSLSPSPR